MRIENAKGKPILMKMVSAIQDNKAYLCEIDGLIGDGDHGANMNKGFTKFAARIQDKELSFTDGLDELGDLLFDEIGGSMGPIYGTLFNSMASAGSFEYIGTKELAEIFQAGLSGLQEIVDAKVGDKTLIDTLSPAVNAMNKAASDNLELSESLPALMLAAEVGCNSTKDLVARHGRSARLGERSAGVLDAGAVSCFILIKAIVEGIQCMNS